MIARLSAHRGAFWLLVATSFANVIAYLYQVVMARLLRPEDYAILTALFGIILVESIGAQVIQAATARIAARYRALGDEAALHVFVRRWSKRIAVGAVPPALLVALAAAPISDALSLSHFSVALLGVTLFFAAALTFTAGLLQGLARFGWLGSNAVLQAGTRLAVGVALVLLGAGVDGAIVGAASALAVGFVGTLIPLAPLFRAARDSSHEAELGSAETRFFLRAALMLLAYAALTNMDAVVARARLLPEDAGAYAGAITMAKVVLFAPIAVGFILLERTARAHAQGRDTERALFLALGFVLATSGAVAAAYGEAPAFFTALVIGGQYPATASIVGLYGAAALSNALLTLWNAYFIGRGEMKVGALFALAVVVQLALLLAVPRDIQSMVRVVLGVSLAMQVAAIAIFVWELALRRRVVGARVPR